MQTSSPLDLLFLGKDQATHALVILHGLGADAANLAPLYEALENLRPHMSLRGILPNAPLRPIEAQGGLTMRGWYDIPSWDWNLRIREDEAGILASVEVIHALIDDLVKTGIPSERIFLIGFSQGAAIAAASGLRYTQTLGGVAMLSGYLPIAERTEKERHPVNHSLPFFVAHGFADPVVPILMAEVCVQTLKQWDQPHCSRYYSILHNISEEEIEDLSQWLGEHGLS